VSQHTGYKRASLTAQRLILDNGKGVICKIANPEDMPIDSEGNRADIIMDDNSTVSRMNLGRLYEQFINSASRDVAKVVTAMINSNLTKVCEFPKINVISIFNNEPANFKKVYDYLLGYYKLINPLMYETFTSLKDDDKINHLSEVIKNGIYLYIPTNSEIEYTDMVRNIQLYYPPVHSPVTYRGNSGIQVITKKNVRIGSVYIMLLEKIADQWSALSSGKFQHFGVLAQLTRGDKYASPVRVQAVKGIGETEGRILASYAGAVAVGELMDRNNSQVTHRDVVESLLNAPVVTNITKLVDRVKIPYGGARPIQLVNHVAFCGGYKYQYYSRKENYTLKPNNITV
jgi:RNA polymerase Rpb2, domain 6